MAPEQARGQTSSMDVRAEQSSLGGPRARDADQQDSVRGDWYVAGYAAAAVLLGSGAYGLWLSPVDRAGGGPVASVTSGVTINFEGRFQ